MSKRCLAVFLIAGGLAAVMALGVAIREPDPAGDASTPGSGVPLVQVAEPPDQPPVVELVATDELLPVQRGNILNGLWRTGSERVDLSTDAGDVPWPQTSLIPEVSHVAVRIPGESFPAFLTVQVYGGVFNADGSPRDSAIFVLDCATVDMLSNGDCQLTKTSGYLVLGGIEIDDSTPSRIAVNVHWPDPAGIELSDTTVWATWLFSVQRNSSSSWEQ